MINIKNFRQGKMSQPWDYRCDRYNKVFGNHVGKDLYRTNAIEAFQEFLDIALADVGPNLVKEEINKLYRIHQKYGQLNLWCWCTPAPCHTEVIKYAILALEEEIERRQPKCWCSTCGVTTTVAQGSTCAVCQKVFDELEE